MTKRTGRFSLKPIAALLVGASCAAVLPSALGQTPTRPTVQELQERVAAAEKRTKQLGGDIQTLERKLPQKSFWEKIALCKGLCLGFSKKSVPF